MWILGNFKTLSKSNSVWEELVIDAKNRGCFFKADADAISNFVERFVPLLDHEPNVDIDGGECRVRTIVAIEDKKEDEKSCKGRSLEIMEGKNIVEEAQDSKAVTRYVRHTNWFQVKIEKFIVHCVSGLMGKLLGR